MEKVSPELWATAEQLAELLIRYVVPILEKDVRGYTCGHGTGILVSHRNLNFLVTAAHVLDPLKEGRKLFMHCASGTTRSLAGMGLSTIPATKGIRESDSVDIGVIRLEGPGQPPYPEIGKYSLPFKMLRADVLPRQQKDYFVTGFPATKTKTNVSKRTVVSEPIGNISLSIYDSDYAQHDLVPRRHIAIEFDVKKVLSKCGRLERAPDPKGLSGSPIWLLPDFRSENSPKQPVVVGIAIEHHRTGKLLVGSDISIAIDMINKLTNLQPD